VAFGDSKFHHGIVNGFVGIFLLTSSSSSPFFSPGQSAWVDPSSVVDFAQSWKGTEDTPDLYGTFPLSFRASFLYEDHLVTAQYFGSQQKVLFIFIFFFFCSCGGKLTSFV
jgi:hypothetical protein